MSRPGVFHFSFSFAHHGVYSSYHRMLHYLPKDDASLDASNRLIDRLPDFVQRRTLGRWRRFSEMRAWHKADQFESSAFHYLYPENTCFTPGKFKGNRKVVLSCHQPQSFLERLIASPEPYPLTNGFAVADAIMVMGPAEVEIYRDQAPQARVEFIPHGIDAGWFHPPARKVAGRTAGAAASVFTAGNWLRDYKTWAAVVNRAASDDLSVRFTILANADTLREALGMLTEKALGIVDRRHGVSDVELRDIYWQSDLVFLPLLDATANNVVLEALACGCPLLVPRLPSTHAYALEAAAYFDPCDPDAVYSQLRSLLEDEAARRSMALAGRVRVEEALRWERVMEMQGEFLAKLP